jgi:hypothetical protein
MRLLNKNQVSLLTVYPSYEIKGRYISYKHLFNL